MSPPAGIFLVDDHPMVREGLANVVRGAGLVVAGEAGSIRETLEHSALAESALVIVDLALGEESGLELIKRLRARDRAVLVYSMHERPEVIRKALEAGAGGYVTKREASGSLLEAIGAVMAGIRFLSPRAEKAIHRANPADALIGQQQEIYRLMGRGLSNDEVARQLGISVRTLESYGVRMMDKLGVPSMNLNPAVESWNLTEWEPRINANGQKRMIIEKM